VRQIEEGDQVLSISQIEALKSAAKKMQGAKKRSFQAEITEKYFNGSARIAERVFGWGRKCSYDVSLGKNYDLERNFTHRQVESKDLFKRYLSIKDSYA